MRSNVRKLLMLVRTKIPKVFVNVIGFPTKFRVQFERSISCYAYKKLSDVLGWDDKSVTFEVAGKAFNSILKKEAHAARTDTFYPVFQPFLIDHAIGKDMTEALTCFHMTKPFSEKVAVGLWNAMLSPGKKTTSLKTGDVPRCPRAEQRLH
eukprot:gnl/TRDRNA2_/TRDRNA2_159306_c0_seq2.p1 gnl/TRDRNA2_/TRDRNA2_159306_c0~~gnl/TRDRNA2_/TRDRNA2_159306_c0_seq2.p1  ORF type:complete len:169 (+),score=21.42 gnl/TRDRNA2_/TRDRNA2_159306_c0_seq2:57-509(+)